MNHRKHPRMENILRSWRKLNETSVEYGKMLYYNGYFRRATEVNMPIDIVYDEVIAGYHIY